jgi:hypothetical protein
MSDDDDGFFLFFFNLNNNISFKGLLNARHRRQRGRRIPRAALVDPSESAWVRILLW